MKHTKMLRGSFPKIGLSKEYLIYDLAPSIPINQKVSTPIALFSAIVSVFGFKKKELNSFLKIALPLFFLYAVYVVAYARDGFGLQIFEKKASTGIINTSNLRWKAA